MKYQYIRDFEKLAFGLFIHWGLYSLLESGEWVKFHHKIADAEYQSLSKKFTAEHFAPEKIVSFAKKSGMKYICLTTRHHDGFSLYDTEGLSSYDAPHSPAGRDLIAEYARACHKLKMPMFFYHTTIDWKMEKEMPWQEYLQYLRDSVEILCKNYGKVAGFWFDGNWAHPDRDWQEDQLYGLVRKYHPEAMIINNTSTGARGSAGHPEIDSLTFEQGTPEKKQEKVEGKKLASEMCETVNSHWGFSKYDYSCKSPAELIKTLAECRSSRANLLLNMGLTAEGAIPDYEKVTFPLVGQWIKRCAAGLYHGVPADLVCKNSDFILQKDGDYYYYLFNLPIYGNEHLLQGESGGGLKTVAGELPELKEIRWVDNDEQLSFSQDLTKNMLTFRATPYPYGHQYIVRVARLVVK